MGLLAAQQLGKFWPFALKLYQEFDSFDPSKLPDMAAAVGMDRGAFAALLTDSSLRNRLIESKKEGIRNKVEATPTVFINGRKYVGDMATAALHDVLEEESER
jgi:protein-disulfide isomerase